MNAFIILLVSLLSVGIQIKNKAVTMIANSTLFDVVGLFGVLFYIGSYGALQLGRINGHSLLYSGLNATAAILVLISLYKDFNLASVLIQITWISVSLAGATRLMLSTCKSKNSLHGRSTKRRSRQSLRNQPK